MRLPGRRRPAPDATPWSGVRIGTVRNRETGIRHVRLQVDDIGYDLEPSQARDWSRELARSADSIDAPGRRQP